MARRDRVVLRREGDAPEVDVRRVDRPAVLLDLPLLEVAERRSGRHVDDRAVHCLQVEPGRFGAALCATLFAAVPERSTPAPPSTANAAVEPAAFNLLKHDFSSCCLPYSQALDVARVYLRHFCTTRYETMRAFRRCITEFVLDPENEPTGFQPHLWRFPVRIDIAIEYLCITPEEYTTVFRGHWPEPCGGSSKPTAPGTPA